MDRKSLFAKMASASVTSRADRIVDGSYLLTVKKLLIKDGENGTFFIGEFRVDKATAKSDTIKPNAVGSTVGFAYNIGSTDKKHKSAMGNSKAFVLALDGNPDMSNDEFMNIIDLLTKDENNAAGLQIKCETYRADKRDGQGTYLGLNWHHVALSDDEIAANRQSLAAN